MSNISIINSMTGFGRAEEKLETLPISVEIKSVNHCYCEVRCRLPRELTHLEPKIRQHIQEKISRGRIEVLIRTGSAGEELPVIPSVNMQLAQQYLDIYSKLAQNLGLEGEKPTTTQLLQIPGILTTQPNNEILESLEEIIMLTLNNALQPFLEMRKKEGNNLYNDLISKLQVINLEINKIEEKAPLLAEIQFKKLVERIEKFELPSSIEKERLHQEIAIWSDKCDISEELTRIHSHLQQFSQLLEKGGVIGRRCDFLCQELHREANTIGSKNQDATIASSLISLKANIEKMREQVQNIE